MNICFWPFVRLLKKFTNVQLKLNVCEYTFFKRVRPCVETTMTAKRNDFSLHDAVSTFVHAVAL